MIEKLFELVENERVSRGMSKVELCRRSNMSVAQYINFGKGLNLTINKVEALLNVLEIKKISIKL